MNERADNAILVTHFFSATSHAAGRHTTDDKTPRYWDSIIGGKEEPIEGIRSP